jgi:DNA-binding response OmpR family regulator
MASSSRKRILIVEDDHSLRRTLARVLAQTFDVIEAAHGSEAVAILGTESFDAVITDLEMPKLGGDGLVAWLEAHQPRVAGRVIVMTGGARRAEQARWLQSFDPHRVVAKPCSASVIVTAIESLLARHE